MSEKKSGNEAKEGAKKLRIPTSVIVTVFFLATVAVMFIIFLNYLTYVDDPETEKLYDRYYAMIVPDRESSFWNEVYESAHKIAEEQGIYVEMLGKSMLRQYSREDQLRIAVAESVDGIIVVADESEEMRELISLATESGIPVVTLVSDCPSSDRCSFVGINIGREYGNLIVRLAGRAPQSEEPVRVAVLVNGYTEASGQNILCMGIQETVEAGVLQGYTGDRKVDISLVQIDDSNAFSTQEGVRELVFGPDAYNPDIIVGVITVLGYHDSPAILNAIDRSVIEATISIDTEQLGSSCVEALSEYIEYGLTSQYITADSLLIDSLNVSKYLKKEVPDEK